MPGVLATGEVNMRYRVVCYLICAVAVSWPVEASGQVRDADQPTLVIDAKARDEVIDAILKRLDGHYVFPDVATKMGQAVRQRQKDGQYDNVKTGQELAQLLTRHLQDVSKDKHLRVNCS